MTRHDKIVEAVFGSDTTSDLPEWKQIQEQEQKRRDSLRDKLRGERLAREAANAKTAESKPPSRRRKTG